MAVNKGYSKYQSNLISTSRPEDLTLMLYNGLIRFIMQAQKSIEGKNMEAAHENIVRAEDIITEFQVTLDTSYEISTNLMLLYDFMKRRLIEANLKKDTKILIEVLKFAKEFRDTWEQAMKIARDQNSAPQTIAK